MNEQPQETPADVFSEPAQSAVALVPDEVMAQARAMLIDGKDDEEAALLAIARRLADGKDVNPAHVADLAGTEEGIARINDRVSKIQNLRRLAELASALEDRNLEFRKATERSNAFKEERKNVLKALEDKEQRLRAEANRARDRRLRAQDAESQLRRLLPEAMTRRWRELDAERSRLRREAKEATDELLRAKNPENTHEKQLKRVMDSISVTQGWIRGEPAAQGPRLRERLAELETRRDELKAKTTEQAIDELEGRFQGIQSRLRENEKASHRLWEDIRAI